VSSKVSAGFLVYRRKAETLEVLLVHPGGPFWRSKDVGAWTIPKGEPLAGEGLEAAASRELLEEVGLRPPGSPVGLGWVKQKGGKIVHAWAVEIDPSAGIQPASNTLEVEWPPRSGQLQVFPEVDRAEFFALPEAERKINPAQRVFLERLLEREAR
jgi:predicted NUDIX family NTP pyrophosphohydrolase